MGRVGNGVMGEKGGVRVLGWGFCMLVGLLSVGFMDDMGEGSIWLYVMFRGLWGLWMRGRNRDWE